MSKLEQARQIQLDAGRTKGILKSSLDGCVCPLGALAIAHGVEVEEFDHENEAYVGTNEEHAADILTLGHTAYQLCRGREFSEVRPDLADRPGKAAAEVYYYNDFHLHTNEEAVALFDAAIARREANSASLSSLTASLPKTERQDAQ
jgi:hypothetical protein